MLLLPMLSANSLSIHGSLNSCQPRALLACPNAADGRNPAPKKSRNDDPPIKYQQKSKTGFPWFPRGNRFRPSPATQTCDSCHARRFGNSTQAPSTRSQEQIRKPLQKLSFRSTGRRISTPPLAWKCTSPLSKRKVVFLQKSVHFHVGGRVTQVLEGEGQALDIYKQCTPK